MTERCADGDVFLGFVDISRHVKMIVTPRHLMFNNSLNLINRTILFILDCHFYILHVIIAVSCDPKPEENFGLKSKRRIHDVDMSVLLLISCESNLNLKFVFELMLFI